MNLLRRLLPDADLDAAWLRDPLVADKAMDDAFQFESISLNTPRDGLERLWQIDVEVAFEAFEEGLRRGGRASEGLAATAVSVDPSRAAAIIVERYPNVSDEKVRNDLGRALRGVANRSALEVSVAEMLSTENEPSRITALNVAGWLATPALDRRVLDIRRGDARSSIQKAAYAAADRSDRLQSVAALVSQIKMEDAPHERRRLLAIAMDMDKLKVLTTWGDPLYIGNAVRDDRELKLVNLRRKT